MDHIQAPAPAGASALSSTRTETVSVYTRHQPDCSKKGEGRFYRKCTCPKWLYIYRNGKDDRRSAKTRSWQKAEDKARELLDSWDPDKQEIKRLRAEKEGKQIPLEDGIALYHADMIARVGENGTVAMSRSLLGHIDPETREILRLGHWFTWLSKFNVDRKEDDQIRFLHDITPGVLTAWRATWPFNDLTKAQRWTMVKQFLIFCERQDWIKDSPARKLQQFEISKGNRTAIFSEDEYNTILDAIPLYDPENVPAATRRAWRERLHIFTELLRWTGMALIDAVQWKPVLVDSTGVLRYRRHKTKELAIVPLPAHLQTLLRDIPLERDTAGPEQPFRTKDIQLSSDTHKWEVRYERLFELARIKEVRTEQGRIRKPHPHMFRDTFAVWYLSNGTRLRTVSKMMGHAKTETTEKAYLPWVKELHDAHVEDARRVQQSLKKVLAIRERRGRNVVNIASTAKSAG